MCTISSKNNNNNNNNNHTYTISSQIKKANRDVWIVGISFIQQTGHDEIGTRTNQGTRAANNAGKRQGNELLLDGNIDILGPFLHNWNHDPDYGCIVQKG
jgi:hypothetical protein